jgi:C_GCAxxG_C_C family probable redox protein
MTSDKSVRNLFEETGHRIIDRRRFFTLGAGGTAGLTLLAFPVMGRVVWATPTNKSKEEILKGLEVSAAKFMQMYGSCAKASFAALNEQLDLKADQILAAIMPFTGGIVAKGETCGAVSGSMLAIGHFFESIKQQPGSSMKFGGIFFDGFEKEFGSTRCREVVKHQYGRYFDFANPEEQKSFLAESKKGDRCTEVVRKAILIAGNLILENS